MWIEVLKKELRHKFFSPLAYFLYFTSLFILGWMFFSSVYTYNMIVPIIMQYPYLLKNSGVMDAIIAPFLTDVGFFLVLVTPFITMLTYSVERKNGTAELLLTYPISDWGLVIGKFFADLILVSVVIIGTLVYVLVYAKYQTAVELKVVLSGTLGLLLMAGLLVSIGNFISSLTDSVFISAIVTLVLFLSMWVLGSLTRYSPEKVSAILDKLSLYTNLTNFTKGIIDMQSIAFFLGFTFLFLYLTVRSLETRYWSGSL